MLKAKVAYKIHVRSSVLLACLVSTFMFFVIVFTNEDAAAGDATKAPMLEKVDSSIDETLLRKVHGSFEQQGLSTFYADDFHGKKTANGERFDMNGFTAAHLELPFGSILRVTNPTTKTSILVEVNDRGPYIKTKILDLSRCAARTIDVWNHRVAINGFMPSDFRRKESYVGFTAPSYEAVEIPKEHVYILDTLTNFTKAMRLHRTYSLKNSQDRVYLIVTPSHSSPSSKNGYDYLIGTLRKPEVPFDASTLVAEDELTEENIVQD